MSVYFSNFPRATHTGKLLRDITRRCALSNTVLNNKFAYLPYLITGNEKPEEVALYYYGSVEYTWLVYYSAGVIDPYYDWPLDSRQFNKYLINKYKQQANSTGYDVLAWTQNTEITENIVHYKNADGDKISPETYTLDANIIGGDWTAVRIYDYESEINDDKRSITLLERSYARQAEEQLRELLNDGTV